jgi:hypothetical protein
MICSNRYRKTVRGKKAQYMIVQIALIAVVFSGNILGIPCNKKER